MASSARSHHASSSQLEERDLRRGPTTGSPDRCGPLVRSCDQDWPSGRTTGHAPVDSNGAPGNCCGQRRNHEHHADRSDHRSGGGGAVPTARQPPGRQHAAQDRPARPHRRSPALDRPDQRIHLIISRTGGYSARVDQLAWAMAHGGRGASPPRQRVRLSCHSRERGGAFLDSRADVGRGGGAVAVGVAGEVARAAP